MPTTKTEVAPSDNQRLPHSAPVTAAAFDLLASARDFTAKRALRIYAGRPLPTRQSPLRTGAEAPELFYFAELQLLLRHLLFTHETGVFRMKAP